MESTQQLQMVVAEVQGARQQVASLNAQLRELEGTIAAVKNQPEDMSLHRQMGSILVEVEDRDQLIKNKLKEIEPDSMTPIEAIKYLDDLKKEHNL